MQRVLYSTVPELYRGTITEVLENFGIDPVDIECVILTVGCPQVFPFNRKVNEGDIILSEQIAQILVGGYNQTCCLISSGRYGSDLDPKMLELQNWIQDLLHLGLRGICRIFPTIHESSLEYFLKAYLISLMLSGSQAEVSVVMVEEIQSIIRVLKFVQKKATFSDVALSFSLLLSRLRCRIDEGSKKVSGFQSNIFLSQRGYLDGNLRMVGLVWNEEMRMYQEGFSPQI